MLTLRLTDDKNHWNEIIHLPDAELTRAKLLPYLIKPGVSKEEDDKANERIKTAEDKNKAKKTKKEMKTNNATEIKKIHEELEKLTGKKVVFKEAEEDEPTAGAPGASADAAPFDSTEEKPATDSGETKELPGSDDDRATASYEKLEKAILERLKKVVVHVKEHKGKPATWDTVKAMAHVLENLQEAEEFCDKCCAGEETIEKDIEGDSDKDNADDKGGEESAAMDNKADSLEAPMNDIYEGLMLEVDGEPIQFYVPKGTRKKLKSMAKAKGLGMSSLLRTKIMP